MPADAQNRGRLPNNCGGMKDPLHSLPLWRRLLHSFLVNIDMWWAVILNGAQWNEESLTLFRAVAALEGIASLSRSQARGIVTIDMWWSVILNGAQRNEESLSYVAALEEILRCAQNDKAGLISIY